MKSFAIIGIGRFGSSVAQELYNLGNEVLAIDICEETVQKISPFVTHAVCADAKDETVLASLGIRNFDTVIVSIAGEIQNSILVTVMLKELGVSNVVAKAQNKIHSRVLQKIGADKIVFPEYDMGIKIAQSLDTENVIDLIELSDDYSIVEICPPVKWTGKTIIQLDVRVNYGINILAIKRGKDINVSPDPTYKICDDDVLFVVGDNNAIKGINK